MGKRIPEEGKAFLPQGFQVRSQPVQFIETGLAPLLVAEGRTFFVQQPGDDAAVETVRYHFLRIPEQRQPFFDRQGGVFSGRAAADGKSAFRCRTGQLGVHLFAIVQDIGGDIGFLRPGDAGAKVQISGGREEENRIRRIDGREALPMLLQQVYRPASQGAMEKTLTLIERLAERAGLYRLGCNMRPEAAKVSYEGMRGEHNEAEEEFCHA